MTSDALFDLPETTGSATSRAVRDALAKIREERGGTLAPAEAVAAASALALAESIDRGAAKGRSTANDVAQLTEQMKILTGDTETDAGDLSAADRRFLDALTSPPALDPAPARDAA